MKTPKEMIEEVEKRCGTAGNTDKMFCSGGWNYPKKKVPLNIYGDTE